MGLQGSIGPKIVAGFLGTLTTTAIVMAFGVGYALLKRKVTDWKWLLISGALFKNISIVATTSHLSENFSQPVAPNAKPTASKIPTVSTMAKNS
jgi:hypothetical protein